MKHIFFKLSAVLVMGLAAVSFCGTTGCGIYSFSEKGTLDSGAKTVKVNFITNEAPYVNPQLSPALTERLKQKIVNQTKLRQVNNDAHYNITAVIKDYSVTTSGVSTGTSGRQQSSINRLSVGVHVTLFKSLKNVTEEFDVSRNFDFDANRTLQSVESTLLDDMVKNLTDEIFNHIFSNW